GRTSVLSARTGTARGGGPAPRATPRCRTWAPPPGRSPAGGSPVGQRSGPPGPHGRAQQLGAQLVGAVGAGRLVVEPVAPVGQRDHAEVPQASARVRGLRNGGV